MPYYVVDAMHAVPGLAGLFVAGIFSASLSTISASCNALAAVTLSDYVSRSEDFVQTVKLTMRIISFSYFILYTLECTKEHS